MRLLLIGSTMLTVTLCGCATQSQVAAGQHSRAPVASASRSATGSAASLSPAVAGPSSSSSAAPSPSLSPASTSAASSSSAASGAGSPAAFLPADPPGTIRWLDLPGEHLDPTPLPTPPPTAVAPPCRADQLRVRDRQGPGDTQDSGIIVRLVNASTSTCLLAGEVHATLFSDALPPRSIASAAPSDGLTADRWDMRPGEMTSIWFHATSGCDGGLTTTPAREAITAADITVPGGGHLRIGGLSLVQTCHGPTVSDFFRPSADPVYGPQPLHGARMRILAPGTVNALSTLRYVVEVTNPTDTAITMRPCPSYHQFLSPYPDKRFYGLNCDGHTELAPHETLRFAMQLAVPPQEENGRQKVVWLLDTTGAGPQPAIVDIVGSTVSAAARTGPAG